MKKEALQELMYDIERAKNWESIHNLIMEYANDVVESDMSDDTDICSEFDEDLWNDIISSIEHGEILEENAEIRRMFGLA